MFALSLFLFTLFCITVIYLLNAFLAHRFKKINYKYALLYITTVALLGVFGEILIDSLFKIFIGRPLWEYHLLPIHNGYTSYYSLAIWGMYGFYLYIFHDFLSGKRSRLSKKYITVIVGLEALALEIAINTLYLAFFGDYIFYYLPNDFWHLTSVQAIPFYLLLGIVISKCIERFRKDFKFFIAMNISLVSVMVFFA